MSEVRMWGDGESGTSSAAIRDADGRYPSLRDFVHGRVCDLLARLEGDDFGGLYRLVIGEVEDSLLKAVMEETAGHQGRAARILGISRGTLRKKLRTHGLVPQAPQPTGGGGG